MYAKNFFSIVEYRIARIYKIREKYLYFDFLSNCQSRIICIILIVTDMRLCRIFFDKSIIDRSNVSFALKFQVP